MIEGFLYKRKKMLKKKLNCLDNTPIYTAIRDAYEKDDFRSIREVLFDLLWALSKDKVTKDIVNSFIKCIKERDSGNPNFESVYKTFIEYIKGLSSETYSFTQWYKLRAACNVVSLFEAGYICRNKSKEAVLKCEVENEYVFEQKFHVFMEQKEYEKAYELVNKIHNPKIDEIYKFFMGENNDEAFSDNEEFDKFLTNNEVLIAGPAPLSDKENEIEFDKYRILGINYLGKDNLFGKPDISYCGEIIEVEMKKDEEHVTEVLNQLDYIVFRNSIPDWWNSSKEGVLSFEAKDIMFMNAVANTIPFLVYFLCRKVDLKPLVVGTNLYAGKLYSDDYSSGLKFQKQNGYSLSRSSAKHDPTAQFLFMKRAYEAGLFETTSELQEILSLSEEEYIKRYQANIWRQGC